jgi:Kelch motif
MATELTAGATPETAETVLRKHFSEGMSGPNWDAMLAAIAAGDQINWDNAQLAFDQLFKSSASGIYLDRQAANDGLSRPVNLGMSDDLFRLLTIKLATNKITHQSIRDILEIFYGRDALRAYVESDLPEPYDLSGGADLQWTIDELNTFSMVFQSSMFSSAAVAGATEVAAVLTQAMRQAGSQAFAAAIVDTNTGATKVRIYSGSSGLKSFVRVTGGSSQDQFRFPAYRNIYSGAVFSGLGYAWVFSVPQQNVSRMSLTTVGMPIVDVSSVQIGDYVVFGSGIGTIQAGTYPVKNIATQWVGADLIQTIDFDAELGFVGSYTQQQNGDFQFFAPQKNSVLNGNRTVVVSQTQDGVVDIQLPATTQAVNRTINDAAYVKDNGALVAERLYRDGSGNAGCVFASVLATPLPVGSSVFIDDAQFTSTRPWVSRGSYGIFPAIAQSDASFGTTWSGMQGPPTQNLERSVGLVLLNGDGFMAGGRQLVSGTYVAHAEAKRLRLVATAAVTDGSEATGASRTTYQWIATSNMNVARCDHRMSLLPNGQVLVTGGFNGSGKLSSTEMYSPTSNYWSINSPYSMTSVRTGHTQTTLADGRVFVTGGANTSNALASTEFFNVGLQTWSAGPNMTVARNNHEAVLLPDGRLMLIGGQVGSGAGSLSNPTSDVLNSTEFFSPATGLFSPGPPMVWGRSHHRTVLLADGRVLVVGGAGRRFDKPTPVNSPSYIYWPTNGITETEVWDPKTNTFSVVAASAQPWVDANVMYFPALNSVWVTHGSGIGTVNYGTATPGTVTNGIEILDLGTMKWSGHFLQNTASRDRSLPISNSVVVFTGGNDTSNTFTSTDLLLFSADKFGGGGIRDEHQIATSSLTGFTFVTPSQKTFCTNFGDPSLPGGTTFDPTSGLYLPSNYSYLVSTGSRNGGNTSLNVTGTAGLNVGDRVFVNLNASSLGSGVKQLTAVTTGSVTYADAGPDVSLVATSGAITVNKGNATVSSLEAIARAPNDEGPHIFDPASGLALTSIRSTLASALQKGHNYDRMQVASTADFPNEFGYVVLAYGFDSQSEPIPYLKTVGTGSLLLDFTHTMAFDYPAGTSVDFLPNRGPFVATGSNVTNFYLTGSSAGRLAAQSMAEAASAAGFTLNFDVVFPGDRGVGGEGFPTEGTGKLSDIQQIFGGDS